MRRFSSTGWFSLLTGGAFALVGLWMVRDGAAFGWVVAIFGTVTLVFGLWERREARTHHRPAEGPGLPALDLTADAPFRRCPMDEAEASASCGRIREQAFEELDVSVVRSESIHVPVSFELTLGRIDDTSLELVHALALFRKDRLQVDRRRFDVDADGTVMIGDAPFTMMPVEEDFAEQATLLHPLDLPLDEVASGMRDAARRGRWEALPDWFRDPLEHGEFSEGMAFAEHRSEPCDAVVRFPAGWLYCYYAEL